MSTQETAALIESVNNMTATVAGKIAEIDAEVERGIVQVKTLVTKGHGNYVITGSVLANQWIDVGDIIGEQTTFSIDVISTENSQIQLQQWAFIFNSYSNFNTAVRVDKYGEMHPHSNDLFFSLDLGRKKLMVRKLLTTNRTFSIFLRVGTGNVTMVPSGNIS